MKRQKVINTLALKHGDQLHALSFRGTLRSPTSLIAALPLFPRLDSIALSSTVGLSDDLMCEFLESLPTSTALVCLGPGCSLDTLENLLSSDSGRKLPNTVLSLGVSTVSLQKLALKNRRFRQITSYLHTCFQQFD